MAGENQQRQGKEQALVEDETHTLDSRGNVRGSPEPQTNQYQASGSGASQFQESQAVTMGQLREILVGFKQTMTEALREHSAKKSGEQFDLSTPQQPKLKTMAMAQEVSAKKSNEDRMLRLKQAMGKKVATKAPLKTQWGKARKYRDTPRFEPRREISKKGEPSKTYSDARQLIEDKRKSGNAAQELVDAKRSERSKGKQVDLEDTGSTPVLKDTPFSHVSTHGGSHPSYPYGGPWGNELAFSQRGNTCQGNQWADLHSGQKQKLIGSRQYGAYERRPGQSQNLYVPKGHDNKAGAMTSVWKTPFSPTIMAAPRISKVKMPVMDAFDGTTDPDDHLATYKHTMYVQGVDDATWCRYFPATLKGIAQRWFNSLPDHSINNFSELSMVFAHHFMANKQERKTSMHLANVVQGEKETLRGYVQRFNLEALQIPHLTDDVAFDNFFRGLRSGPFKFDVVRRGCNTLQSILNEAEAYIHAQELCASTKTDRKVEERQDVHSKQNQPKKAATWSIGSSNPSHQSNNKKRRHDEAPKFEYTKDLHSMLKECGDKFGIEPPPPMRTPTEIRDRSKYCHFHKDVGHVTNDCFNLRKVFDTLAAKGELGQHLIKSRDERSRVEKMLHYDDPDTDNEVVAVISGGFAAGGPTMKGNKEYLRSLSQVMVSEKKPNDTFPEVLISEKDRGNVRTPHDDPLVIETKVANMRVQRILIDTGSSSDIISYDCLEKLKFDKNSLMPVHHPIIGFGGGIIHPVGMVTLPLRLGNKDKARNMFVKFLVIKDLKAYNIILGRPTLNASKAVIVNHLMLMKFECNDGSVGSLYGDQQTARECYLTTLKPTSWGADYSKNSQKRSKLL